MIKRATVFIPVVTPKDGLSSNRQPEDYIEGRFIEVYAEAYRFGADIADLPAVEAVIRKEQSSYDSKAIDKCWDRVAAPLRKNSPALYQSGCAAANALRKMPFKHRFFAFFQFIKPHAMVESIRLHAVTPWGPTEGSSAELGLALALAASICGKEEWIIVATGALTSTKIANSNTQFRSGDVKVQPVGSIVEKLKLLLFEIQDGAFQEIINNHQFLLIIPKFFINNGLEHEVRTLPEVKTLNEIGVKVVPVDWLSEALAAIKADTTQYLWFDRALQIMLGLLIFFVITIGSWLLWRDTEIPMAFISVSPNNIQAEPFELCARKHQHYAMPISKTLLVPSMPVDSVIGWKIRIGDANTVDSKLAELFGYQGYYIAVIVVSEFTPATFDYARIGNTSKPLRVAPGHSYEGWVKLNERAETNALVILAQRDSQFDLNWLRVQLQKRFPPPTEATAGSWRQDVDAVTDFIKRLAPGSLIFPFVSVKENSKCIY